MKLVDFNTSRGGHWAGMMRTCLFTNELIMIRFKIIFFFTGPGCHFHESMLPFRSNLYCGESNDSGLDHSLSVDSFTNINLHLDSSSKEKSKDSCNQSQVDLELGIFTKFGWNLDSKKTLLPNKKRTNHEIDDVVSRKKPRQAFDLVNSEQNHVGNRRAIKKNVIISDDESQENNPIKSPNNVEFIKSILHKNYPSASLIHGHEVKLEIISQPEKQHRARYLTEGSRGAVKDYTGNCYPEIKLIGYNKKPVNLQVFIGTDDGIIQPHLSYQASKVCGKHSTSCHETKIDQTTVLEMQLNPDQNMTLSCDCIGIIKIRNVDAEKRVEYKGSMSKKRCTKCRIIYRVCIPNPEKSSGFEILQVASSQISCTQPLGSPEILKKSLEECSIMGMKELFIIGKNFHKDTVVIFEELDNGNLKFCILYLCGCLSFFLSSFMKLRIYIFLLVLEFLKRKSTSEKWRVLVYPNKEYLQPNHLICEVPPYKHQAINKPISVNLMVASVGRTSEPHIFTYNPSLLKQDHSGMVFCRLSSAQRMPESSFMVVDEKSSSTEAADQTHEQNLCKRCMNVISSKNLSQDFQLREGYMQQTTTTPIINIQSVNENSKFLQNSFSIGKNHELARVKTSLSHSSPEQTVGINSFQPTNTVLPSESFTPGKLNTVPSVLLIQGFPVPTTGGISSNARSAIIKSVYDATPIPIGVLRSNSIKQSINGTRVDMKNLYQNNINTTYSTNAAKLGYKSAHEIVCTQINNVIPAALPGEGYKKESSTLTPHTGNFLPPHVSNDNSRILSSPSENKEYSCQDQTLTDMIGMNLDQLSDYIDVNVLNNGWCNNLQSLNIYLFLK
ncbi:Nuclear factor of activated T-cells 5 [Nymphon striatum]|nr:Nuclear factor of activated T-cells 5 [Nymphon striatum]